VIFGGVKRSGTVLVICGYELFKSSVNQITSPDPFIVTYHAILLRNISENVTKYVPCNEELASTIVLLKTSFQKVLKWKFEVRLYQESFLLVRVQKR
jgi:ABC-type enterochelin transport system permease subunit